MFQWSVEIKIGKSLIQTHMPEARASVRHLLLPAEQNIRLITFMQKQFVDFQRNDFSVRQVPRFSSVLAQMCYN